MPRSKGPSLQTLAIIISGIFVAQLAVSISSEPAFADVVTFTVPGFTATSPSAINNKGWITGTASNGNHAQGFLRSPNGSITTFKVADSTDVEPAGINSSQVIAGTAAVEGGYLGFIRSVEGTITTFAIPSADSTGISSINDSGAITGGYWVNNVVHGFVRSPDGSVTTFDVPDSIETGAASINNKGEIVGTYYDSEDLLHGFLRTPLGEITTFDPPKCAPPDCVLGGVRGINSSGEIVGFSQGGPSFIRLKDGSFVTFSSGEKEIHALAINDGGTTTGYVLVGRRRYFAFIRAENGKKTTLKESKTISADAINIGGVVVGSIYSSPMLYGFLYTPTQ